MGNFLKSLLLTLTIIIIESFFTAIFVYLIWKYFIINLININISYIMFVNIIIIFKLIVNSIIGNVMVLMEQNKTK